MERPGRRSELELIDQSIALFPNSSKKIIHFDDALPDEARDMCDRGLVSFPTLIVEYEGEQLLRYSGAPDVQFMYEQIRALSDEAGLGANEEFLSFAGQRPIF